MAPDNPKRQYFLDWLRVLAMLAIFSFHCAKFFDYDSWHIKNTELSFGMEVFTNLFSQFLMPLFFLISAIATNYSLEKRCGSSFVIERGKRLLVPLVFGSLIVIAPLQVWIERVTHGDFSGSFMEFYFSHYFHGLYAFGGNFAWMGLHLWYLEMLFIFSLITLPLLLYIKRKNKEGQAVESADPSKYYLYLLALPLIISELIVNLQPGGIGRRDFGGWSLVTYLVFFVLGYIIAQNKKFLDVIERNRRISLVLYIITTIFIALSKLEKITPPYFIFYSILPFASWCALLTIIGFGKKYLSASNSLLKYCNEAVLPFYILHQTVIVGVAYMMLNWKARVMIKFGVLFISSFIIIMLIYDIAIKRINMLRFIFGMKLNGE